jgi:alpha-L-glutamate ligase-like protein
MLWLWRAARKLREQGILGMNQRNAAYILDHNPRSLYAVVDDKRRMHDLCLRIGVPTPALYGEVSCFAEAGAFQKMLGKQGDFVIKPANGSGGRGVVVCVGRQGDAYVRHSGELIAPEQLRQHLLATLSGLHSLGGRPDRALFQQRVRLHPALKSYCFRGIPDVRVILYKNRPAMAMLRLPTRESNGRANLHQGGLGAGVDLDTGRTHHAVQSNRVIARHPDTGVSVVGIRVPYWNEIIQMSCRVARAVGLGYLGIDIVIDAHQGPMLLEANARPGLAIQTANHQGLLPRLREIDAQSERPMKRRQLSAVA